MCKDIYIKIKSSKKTAILDLKCIFLSIITIHLRILISKITVWRKNGIRDKFKICYQKQNVGSNPTTVDGITNMNMNFFYQEYAKILFFLLFSFILASIILVSSLRLSTYNPDAEKLSSYECGFDPYEDARNVFDVRFYLVAILFLIFDLEAIFFFPWCVSVSLLSSGGFWGMIDFIIELLIGYVYAWQVGALDWE